MKIVIQNFKTGVLSVADAPPPRVRPGGVLVRTSASLVSAGTDRAVIGLANKGYLAKAKDRPDLARKVLNKAKTDGLWATYKVVQNLMAEPIPLGYSLVGEVIAVGPDVHDVMVGDRVACGGLGYANHAEIVYVPRNLFVPVPRELDDYRAAYVTLGAIAMHGIHQADQQFGAHVLVVGLGLVGQLTVQLCNAAGFRVIGLDFDDRKNRLAEKFGARAAFHPEDAQLKGAVAAETNGYGVDAVLITAASRDSGKVFDQVAELCRDRARVVVVGDVKMDLSRRAYFEKELTILQSRSYGPGRYDADYEEKGRDYPIGWVRWTERRNMRTFIDLLVDGRVDVDALTTHRIPHAEAEKAYDIVTGKVREFAIGIVLTYPDAAEPEGVAAATPKSVARTRVSGRVGLGVIGTGQFARGILLPVFMATNGFTMIGVASSRGLSAKAVKDKYNGRYATTDWREVLDDDEVQAVVIATRPDSHAQYVIEALRRGKHVFVEKPLCLTKEELQAIEAAAMSSTGVLAVGYNRRYSPPVRAIMRHFEGRQEPMMMMYRGNGGRIPLDSPEGWVHEAGVGGGRIISEVCHFVDTMQAICGARPVRVSAEGINPSGAMLPANDVATVTIGFSDGSLGTVHYWSNGDKSYPKERMEIFCQEKIAVLDNYRRLELVANNKTRTRRFLTQQKGFDEEAKAFLASCRSGEPPIPLESLIDTTLVTFLATEDLAGAADEGDAAQGQ